MTQEHPNFPAPSDRDYEVLKETLRSIIAEHSERFVLVAFDEHGTSLIAGIIPDEPSRLALNRLLVRAIIPPNTTGRL